MWYKVNFCGIEQVWIQSFPISRLVVIPRLKSQSALLLTHSGKENNWIHTFPMGINAMWNAVSSRIWTHVAVSIFFGNNHYTIYAWKLFTQGIFVGWRRLVLNFSITGRMWHKVNFLNRVWIQNFSFLKVVTVPRLKIPFCFSICP